MGHRFYYIKQPRTPSFPTGLVKTESDFTARSVDTGFGRRMLVVAVISVDAYPSLAFSDLTYHLEDTGIGYFLVELCCLIVRRPNLEVVTKRGSFSVMLHMKVCP